MEIRDILVNLEIDQFSPALVACAVDLAVRFDARLIGFSAAEPNVAGMAYGAPALVGTLHEQEQQDIETRLAALERQFRAALPPAQAVAWRGMVERPDTALARIARCADLILTGSNFAPGNRNPQRAVDAGELLVRAGRPILICGMGLARIQADSILVGWKDSREARRAVVDALPLLQAARKVTVATIHEGDFADEKASLDDVLAWLRGHAIAPEGDMVPATGPGPAEALEALATDRGADLIVTGGYGHSRMQEWLVGGMTRDLLSDRTVHRFMSN